MEKSNNQQHQEGPVARKIEDETAKLPSDVFLWTSTAAMGVSLAVLVMAKKAHHYLLANGRRHFCFSASTIKL